MGGHDMRPSSSPSSGDIADGLATNLGEGHYTRFPRETPERVLSAPAATTRARQPFDIERQISGDSQHLSKSQRSTGSGHRVLSKTSSFLRDLLSKRSSEKQERSDGAGAAAEAGASFSTGRTTYTIHPRPYKGFSTPFCGLFATSGGLPTVDHAHPQLYGRGHAARELRLSHQRTDLCALSPCCGILQADHTRYLLTHIRPPSLAKRMCLHVGIPCGLFLLAGYCAGHIRDSYANSVVCTALVYCLVVWIVSACTHARKKRVMVREEILWRLQRREARVRARLEEQVRGGDGPLAAAAESEEYEYYSEDEEEYKKRDYGTALGQTRCEMNCAHRLVSGLCMFSLIARLLDLNNMGVTLSLPKRWGATLLTSPRPHAAQTGARLQRMAAICGSTTKPRPPRGRTQALTTCARARGAALPSHACRAYRSAVAATAVTSNAVGCVRWRRRHERRTSPCRGTCAWLTTSPWSPSCHTTRALRSCG